MARVGDLPLDKMRIRKILGSTLLGLAVLVSVGSQCLARTHEKDGA